MRTFLIIGLTPQGLSILRILSRAGFRVVAFTNTRNAAGFRSRYGEKRLFSSIDDLKRQIGTEVNGHDGKLTCIITSGELLAWVMADFPEIYDICDVQSGPFSLVQRLAHKDLMYNFAAGRGLNCARFVLLPGYSHGQLNFPVILKRNYEIPLFFKVKKLGNEAEFDEFTSRIEEDKRRHIIVQEFVTDDDILNISYQSYLLDGVSKCNFICTQDRRISSGITSYLVELRDEGIKDIIKKAALSFFEGSGYTGFTELEFLYSKKENRLWFIEVNTRTCGLHSVLNHKFSNLADLYRFMDNPPVIIENSEPVAWVNIARDIKARLQVRDFRNLSQFFKSKHDVFDLHDIKPFIFQFFK
jgi:predicted ATP-grasp superfamily ATP-dependent carboligase